MILKRSAVVLTLFAMSFMFAAAFMTHPARAGTHDATAQVQTANTSDATFVATVTPPAVNPAGLVLLAVMVLFALGALPKANQFHRQPNARPGLLLRFGQPSRRPPEYALKI